MRIIILSLLTSSLVFSQALGPVQPATYTIAGGLPSASTWNGGEILITDGASLCDVSTGHQSTRVKAVSNGVIWVTPNCGSGSGGALFSAQLLDFGLTQTSTVATLGASVTSTYPSKLDFGGNAVTILTSPATCTISAGSGSATFYADNTGTLYCGNAGTLTLSCSGCTVTSASSPPNGTRGIWTMGATSGAWNGTNTYLIGISGRDFSTCGSGLLQGQVSGQTQCSLDTTSLVAGSMLTIANASSTGTTAFTLTKLTGAPSTAVIATTSDTGHIIGITVSGAGTTGNAVVQTNGSVQCIFSNATTSGDYVQISTGTNGNCLDTGSSSYPTSGGQVIGRVLSTNGSAGTYVIDLFPSEIQPGSSGGASAWSSITNAAGALTLANAAFGTTFNQTSAVNWTWANTTAATSGAAQASPIINLTGTGWTGSASTPVTTAIQQGWSGVSTPNFLITGPGAPSATGNNSIATINGFGIVNFQYAIQVAAGSANGFSGYNISNLAIVSNGGSGAIGNIMQLGDQNSGHAFGDWAFSHIIGSSLAPIGTVGAAGGTSPTCCTLSGNDTSFTASLTTGSATVSGIIMTVTFNQGFTNIAGTPLAPGCGLTPANAATALLSGATGVYPTPTATTVVINSGPTGLSPATAYSWVVQCIGSNQ